MKDWTIAKIGEGYRFSGRGYGFKIKKYGSERISEHLLIKIKGKRFLYVCLVFMFCLPAPYFYSDLPFD